MALRMADLTDMLADLLALGPKVGEFFLRKLYRCAYDVTESLIQETALQNYHGLQFAN